MYDFLLNMWIMRKIDEGYLQGQVVKKRLTQEQYRMIVNTKQVSIF